jgi:signal transduction histidine kinase
MRTGRIEETTEANRTAAASPVRPRVRVRADLGRPARSIHALATLARLMAGTADAPRGAVLAQAAECVGDATGADRVGIYLAPGLVERGATSGDGVGEPPDLATRPFPLAGGERFLLAASWSRCGLAFKGSLIASRSSEPKGWLRVPAGREIPVVGTTGSVALLTLDGLGIGARGPKQDDAVIETVAALIAGFLERDRLERELAAHRVSRAHTERMAQLGRVASSSAHDLNNVLTAILGYADLLELELEPSSEAASVSGACSQPVRGHSELEEIRVAVARGAAIVEEVLGFGRRRPWDEESVDVAQALGRLDAMLRRVAGSDIDLRRKVASGLPPVRVDGDRLERVLVNLVANARHAIETRPGCRSGRIELAVDCVHGACAAETDAGTLRIVVRDNGCGMSAALKRRIFEPFFTTRGAQGGTGIGLADAADFARRAGGRIEVESAEGEGSEIRLLIPIPTACESAPTSV